MSKPQTSRTVSDKSQNRPQPKNSTGRRVNNGGFPEKSPTGGNANGANTPTASTDAIADADFQAHQKDRLLFLVMNSIGAQMNISTNSGASLEGTLESIDPMTMKVVMKANPDGKICAINFEDLTDFEISGVDLFNDSIKRSIGSFKTDTDISQNKTSAARRGENIEKWAPAAEGGSGISLEGLSLEDSKTSSNWDQFHTNETKFGIKSEFDENLYTTRINKDDPSYKKNMEKAVKLAREIESQGHSGNAHVAEERGLAFDDSGIDEEDKYSGVLRSTTTSPTNASGVGTAKGDALFQSLMKKDSNLATFEADGKTKYVPPAQRSRLEVIDPSIVSAFSNASGKQTKPSTIPSKPPVPTSTKQNENRKITNLKEINSLKEFSQNFKIPTKMPEDLLPILTKDKQKQEEIVKRYEAEALNAKSPSISSPKPTTVVPPTETKPITKQPEPVSTTSPSTTQTSTTNNTPTSKKIEPSKHNYKMNAKAMSFTPSTASSTASPVTSNASSPHFARHSPRISQPNYRGKRQHQGSLFSPDKQPSSDKKRRLGNDFNFFRACRAEFDSTTKDDGAIFRLERPFNTLPTWSDGTMSYKSVFPDASSVKPPVMFGSTPTMQQFPQMAPMMNAPGQFMYPPPQPFMPMRHLSPQQVHPGIAPQMAPGMYMPPGPPGPPGAVPMGGYAPRYHNGLPQMQPPMPQLQHLPPPPNSGGIIQHQQSFGKPNH